MSEQKNYDIFTGIQPKCKFDILIMISQGEESRRAQKEHQEERRQIEEDVDREILGIKDKYERKLKQELDTNMRLKVLIQTLLFMYYESYYMSHMRLISLFRVKLVFCERNSATCNEKLKRVKRKQKVLNLKMENFKRS